MMPVHCWFGYFIGRGLPPSSSVCRPRASFGHGLSSAVLFQTVVYQQSITKELGAIIVMLLVSWALIRLSFPHGPWVQQSYSGTR